MRYIEVEKKFALPDPAALKAKLDELGAKPDQPTRQIDAYYNAPHKDFLAPHAISEWLRVRTEERGSSINYKRWHPVTALVKTHADEYESVISDVHAVQKLLEALDFRPLVTVDKTREQWTLPDVEIVFDHVTGAGDYVEFEFKGDAGNVADATTRLDQFIASLNIALGEPINRGYPHTSSSAGRTEPPPAGHHRQCQSDATTVGGQNRPTLPQAPPTRRRSPRNGPNP